MAQAIQFGEHLDARLASTHIVQEIMHADLDDASALFPEILHQTIIEEAERERTGRQFCDIWPIKSRTVRVVYASGVLHMAQVPETSEIPIETQNYYDKTIEVVKYGVRPLITNEMIEDSEWNVIARHVRLAGQAAGRREDNLFYGVITDTDNVQNVAETTATELWIPHDILALIQAIRASYYRPDTIIFNTNDMYSPTPFEGVLISDWITDAGRSSGDLHPGVRMTGQFGRILGLDVFESNGMPRSHVALLDRKIRPVVLVVRREPQSKQYEDVIKDMTGLTLTMRIKHDVIVPSGISLMDSVST